MNQNPSTPSQGETLWTRSFILIAIVNMTLFAGFNMTTTSMPLYVSSLGAGDFAAGLVTTFATGAALLIRAFTGVLLDRFGRKGILISGIGLMAAATAAYMAFPMAGVILALRVVHGIGWGLGSTATSTIAADAIPKKRFAEGIGYFALASSLAIAIAPALAIGLLQSVGIMPVLVIAGACTLLALILSFFEHSPKAEQTPQKRKFGLSSMFDQKALLPSGMMLLINCAFASITTFIALHGQAQGVSNISLYFTVYAIVTIISRPVIGRLIDKTGFYLPAVLSTLGVIVTLAVIAFSSHIIMFCIAGVFGGLGIGTGMGTLQTMAVSSVPAERRGVATSTFLFGVDAGIALGAALAGVFAGAFGYGAMFLIMAVFPAAACLIFILLGKKRIAAYITK